MAKRIFVYEQQYQNNNQYVMYTLENSLQRSFFSELDEINNHWRRDSESKMYFLADEQHFDFFRFPLSLSVAQGFTIQELKKIINQKNEYIANHISTQGLNLRYVIDDITVNGEKSPYLIGQKGDLGFSLFFMFLKNNFLNTLRSSFGKSYQDVDVYPQSYFTSNCLKNTLNKKDFVIVSIYETYVKCIIVKQGMYHKIEKINLGWQLLKDIYKENNIIQFYYQEHPDLASNNVAKNLVFQSLDFYSTLITQWLMQLIPLGSDMVLISDLLQNAYFLERFGQIYKQFINGFVIPFRHSKDLDDYGKKWNYGEVDMITFLNKYEKVN